MPSRKPARSTITRASLDTERVELVLAAVVPSQRAELVVGAVTGMTHQLGARHTERGEPFDRAAQMGEVEPAGFVEPGRGAREPHVRLASARLEASGEVAHAERDR